MDEKTVALNHTEDEDEKDGCDVNIEEVTLDEDLPAAKGGVV